MSRRAQELSPLRKATFRVTIQCTIISESFKCSFSQALLWSLGLNGSQPDWEDFDSSFRNITQLGART